MKRILIATTTAGLVALAGAASAMTRADAVFTSELQAFAPQVEAESLTSAQIDAIKLVLSSGDSPAEKRAYVYSIVNG